MVYIAADLRFFENPKRDEVLIKNWNNTVKPEDDVLLMGIITNDIKLNSAPLSQLFSQLNGSKIIIDYDAKCGLSREELVKLGISRAYKTYSFVPDKTYTVHILPDDEMVNEFTDKMWGAAPRSLTKFENVFEHNIMSLSIDDWGLTPIEYEQLPSMVEYMMMYNEMGE